MQSGYGVSEIQQQQDGICSPFFPVAAAADIHACSQPQKHHQNPHHLNPFQLQQQHQQQAQYNYYHQFPHLHHHHHYPPPPEPQQQQQQRFPHFHSIPITQQLFQQTHQFHLFQQEQQRRAQHHPLGLDHESGPENSASPLRIVGGSGCSGSGGGGGIPPFLGPAMNFRLSMNESSGGGSRDGLNDEDGGGILHGDDDGSESRLQRWPPAQREEESAIKEPFWRPLALDLDYINRNNKRCKEEQAHQQQQQHLEGSSRANKHFKGSSKEVVTNVVDAEDAINSGSNYKMVFNELEAICKPGGTAHTNIAAMTNNNNNQTGSSSALTGENPPTVAAALQPNDDPNCAEAVDGSTDTSTGEEASLKNNSETNPPHHQSSSSSRMRKEKKRRKRKQQLSSIASFFESLVKQLMEHQEVLHGKFLEVLERRDQERMAMEEAWRQQEAAKSSREAKAMEEQQAIASAREAAIISFLEKITGESLNLPTKAQFQSQLSFHEESQKELSKASMELVVSDDFTKNTSNTNEEINTSSHGLLSSNRWPKAEVQALIRVRSGLETRFQEPGLKGPLWEEVSSTMASMGYHRSAKRCKEKWENINKYFRKTKESAKQRPQHSKTCPYFHLLDQLYSKSLNKTLATTTSAAAVSNTTTATAAAPAIAMEQRGNSELLDPIVVSMEQSGFQFSEMVPSRLEYNQDVNDAAERVMAGKGLLELGRSHNGGEEHLEEGEGDDGEEEEGEGESQAIALAANDRHQVEEEDMEEEEDDDEEEEEEEQAASHEQRTPFFRGLES